MKKYIGICSLILLAACSSDSGGGLNDGWLNIRQGGFSTGMKTASQSQRSSYLSGKITGERNQDTNKAAFDNMYDVLLGNGASSADATKLLEAILVANPGIKYDGDETNADDIRAWINNNKDVLESAARETYMKYGLFLTDVDFAVSNSDVASAPMHFTLNGTDISGINFGNPTDTYVYRNGLFRNSSNNGTGMSVMTGVKSNELQYANFGRIMSGNIKNDRIDTDSAKYATYYGGYEKLAVNAPTSSTTFSGGAAGYVYGRDGKVLSVGGNADFVVDNSGNGVLTAKFNNWYTVKVDGSNINFSNVDSKVNIDANYKFDGGDTHSGTGATMDAKYFGENGTASEVVGKVDYTDSGSNIKLDAVFGGKK